MIGVHRLMLDMQTTIILNSMEGKFSTQQLINKISFKKSFPGNNTCQVTHFKAKQRQSK
jgi:hypothetical protein